jgi:hypothetical protein
LGELTILIGVAIDQIGYCDIHGSAVRDSLAILSHQANDVLTGAERSLS